LRAAVADHAANEGLDLDIAAGRRRDDRLPHSAMEATLETQSPFRLLADIEASGVAIYAYAGWLDAAFQRDLIHLYLNATNPDNRLILGPWAHGARYQSSPPVASEKRLAEFSQAGELVRFFDKHLRGVDRRVPGEEAVQYFTMVEERWKSAPSWPPPGTRPVRWHLADRGVLSADAGVDTSSRYRVDRTATTGVWSRYGKHLSGGNGPADYGDRAAGDAKLLCFTSAPLEADVEVTGHPLAHLWLTCDTEDAGLFVYLEDVGPDGVVRMVTDGCLRLSMRAEGDDPPYRMLGVWHTGRAADMRPVVAGEVMEVRVDLMPTSWLFRSGHCVRVAIAGADADNFVQVPDTDPAPTFEVHHGPAHPSGVELPIA
jgi:putative CocE/NonD family hydrolase